MKLSPEREDALLKELELAEWLTEQSWVRRYGVSARTIRRYRAQVRERHRSLAALRPEFHRIVWDTENMETVLDHSSLPEEQT